MTWCARKSPAASICFVDSLGFSLAPSYSFFSSLISFLSLTIVMLSGVGCTKSESTRLESLLNFACRTVLHRSKHSSASAARQELHLSTLSSRRKLYLSQAVFKCLSSQSPPYLSTLFPLHSVPCFFPVKPPTLQVFLRAKGIQFFRSLNVEITITINQRGERLQCLHCQVSRLLITLTLACLAWLWSISYSLYSHLVLFLHE